MAVNLKLVEDAKKMYSHFLRQLNDAHIFLRQAQPQLVLTPKQLKAKEKKFASVLYFVPSVNEEQSTVKRTDAQLKEIYQRFTSNGLYEAFLIMAVAHFEAYLADLMVLFLMHYPKRSNETVKDLIPCKTISVFELVDSKDKDALLRSVFVTHADSVFRLSPKLYLEYMTKLLGAEPCASTESFCEVAATRDLVVHNRLEINETYIKKAGKKARGKVGDRVSIDALYYDDTMKHMKRVANHLRNHLVEKFQGKKDDDIL